MDKYTSLLVRIRVPQPSLQRFAVIQIFDKLRSSLSIVNSNSELDYPEREAITQCLHSISIDVVEQSVRELCRLVKDHKIDFSYAMIEFQSALEGCPPRFVTIFVKAIGFLVRFGFQNHSFDSESFSDSPENHHFVKVLSCRSETQSELVQQVVSFVLHGKQRGISEVCNYLRPLLMFSVVRTCSSDSSLSSFLSLVISSLTSLCCSLVNGLSPLFEMLICCLCCFVLRDMEDIGKVLFFAEVMVDAYIVVLQYLVKTGSMVTEAQMIGVKLSDALLTLCLEFEKRSIECRPVLVLSRRVLCFQNELKLHYAPQLSSLISSLFVLIAQLKLEGEKLYALEFMAFILKWRIQDGNIVAGVACTRSEVSLFLFPMINLMSSPSRTVKQSVSQLIILLESLFVSHSSTKRDELSLTSSSDELHVQRDSLYVSKLDTIIFRLLQHLWLQDLSPHSYYLNIYSTNGNIPESGSKFWISQLGKYALSIAEKNKSCDSISSQEVMSAEIPFLMDSLAGSLVIHQSLGSYAVETLASLSQMDPKLDVALFLAVLYYCNLLRCNVKCGKDMLSFLLPECFVEFNCNHSIATSMAASLRDICRRNPERGVQLILSVAACIECSDSTVRALGFQSLGYLCEADVVDFYTAWDVIAIDGKGYSTDPVIAVSLCLLLRWGAMDCEAYIEASITVLQMLWDIVISNCSSINPIWRKARIMALEALNYFEVFQIERSIPNFRDKVCSLLIHEIDIHVLQVIEKLERKVINYEHSTRRRLVKENRAPRSKFEKLLEAFPRVFCSSGKIETLKMMPGTALFYLQFNQKEANKGKSNIAVDLFSEYYNMLMAVAASLYLSRNVVIALLSLHSWKTLMKNWLMDYASIIDVKASSTPSDRMSKAANKILKSIMKVAEDCMTIPRVAENIALSMGALCMILPASAHTVKVMASKFLLNWLFQYEHEHRQWPAAIAVGMISTCLHSTDRRQKHQCVNGLLKVAHDSKNSLVKGACGIGLGYSCQDLLTRVVATDNESDEGNFVLQEKALLGMIVRTLSLMIWQLTNISSDHLMTLSEYKAPGLEDKHTQMASGLILKSDEDVEDDTWGVSGLIMGLGMCVGALSKAGSYDAICNIKDLLTSWIAPAETVPSGRLQSNLMLSIGACLVLPTVASICRKLELMHDKQLDDLLFCYEDLILKLQLEKTSNFFHFNGLVASCVGAGSLVAFILDEGLLSLDVQRVKTLLGLFKKIYSGTYPHLVHLGAFLGVVNAMGADTGIISHHCSSKVPVVFFEKKESSHINASLLACSCFEEGLLAILQDMFLVAQDSSDSQLQAYASWAITFLYSHLSSKEDHDELASSLPVSQSFSKDTSVVKLSTWLMEIDYSRKNPSDVNTVASVLRCLSSAPRLPNLYWGTVVQRCMKYEAHITEILPERVSCDKTSLVKECVLFSLAHANKFDSLISLLDELTGLPRFRTIDLVTQSCLLFNLVDLSRIFSSSRTQILLEDISEFLVSPNSSYQKYNTRQKRFLRMSCWKGLFKCFNDDSLDTSEYLSGLEKCMEILFALLPAESIDSFSKQECMTYLEWNESIACMGKTRKVWLSDLLQISPSDLVPRDENFGAIRKKILTITLLVKFGSLPLTELAKLKSCMLNTQSQGMWELFVELMAVLKASKGSIRRQWLIDVLEISCITKHPSTALQFVGLLSGCFCKYMPLLILEPKAVLLDLPVTLSSLLSSIEWSVIAHTAVSYLWTLTLRIHNWAKTLACDGESPSSDIDPSEAEMSNLLIQVLLDTCHNLREFLCLKDQLLLANLI
ncbi:protein RST1 isoform X2 [Amaranthus tricolor]|uniref:protein RST1 isoform X2 n=1 Tax=Amaranthus tricolor TaxID=29722 RepID=UPI0025884178|nr:protein RST1 isoform X2 [Amaranthus tricolor]